jgi:hypothetical protein
MTDYKITASTRRCVLTGRELKPGDRFFSVLREEAGKFVRVDYSADAWQGPPPDAFSFWAGRIPTDEGRRRPPIDDELLLDCFQRLEGQDDPARVRFRYVVALFLMRRRRFRFEEAVMADGLEVLCLRCTRTGARHRVVNPGLTDEEVLTVQEEVFSALGWE